MTEIQTLWN